MIPLIPDAVEFWLVLIPLFGIAVWGMFHRPFDVDDLPPVSDDDWNVVR